MVASSVVLGEPMRSDEWFLRLLLMSHRHTERTAAEARNVDDGFLDNNDDMEGKGMLVTVADRW
jgi:hypothetical protein